ncbi:MAG: homoserine kinase [Candidatus Nezhaarchaeota archaeon]|nr:homoserine kinase [Candidatus Nezhaarchaeota archaeon]MCX8141470.1 homoserine kinase [Candidatus Nezhaarchaeota archaeon]MDW8049736.1 homoserine kinase [Nitrososphaerota archaeon]
MIIARAPATSANLGPGFDVIGVALDLAHDEVEVEVRSGSGIDILVEGLEASQIPTNPERNSAGLVAKEIMKKVGVQARLKIRIKKGVPQGVGLGSSAASASATAVAVAKALDLQTTTEELVEIAAMGEVASSGVAHADNVAPSLLGGFVAILSYNPIRVEKLMPPPNLEFVLAIPKSLKKTTEKARAVLPRFIELREHVEAMAAYSMLLLGIIKGDVELIGRAMNSDKIVETARAKMYPGFLKAKKRAIESGALGVTLSGAGPTAIAVVDARSGSSWRVAEAMSSAYEEDGVECSAAVCRPKPIGVEVFEK